MTTAPTDFGGYPTQELGDNLNSWGVNSTAGLNNAINLMSYKLHSVLSIAMTGDVTLTSTNYAANQSRRAGLVLTDGGLSSAPTITAPSAQSVYCLWNATGYTVSFKTSGGSAVSLATGIGHVVACDATEMYVLTARRLDQLDAPTGSVAMNSQKLTGLGAGTASTDAVTLSQMNTAIAAAGTPASSGAVLISANDTTSRYLADAIVAGAGLSETEDNDGGDETLTLAVDIDNTTAVTTLAAGDKILVYDADASALRAVTHANFLALATGAVDMNGNGLTVDAVTVQGAISGGDQEYSRPKFKDISEARVQANTGTAYEIDLEAANVFELTLTDDCTFTFSNPPASGTAGSFMAVLKQDGTGSRTATWPSSVYWPDGSAPTLTTTATTGVDIFAFMTVDGGTTWWGVISGQDFS